MTVALDPCAGIACPGGRVSEATPCVQAAGQCCYSCLGPDGRVTEMPPFPLPPPPPRGVGVALVAVGALAVAVAGAELLHTRNTGSRSTPGPTRHFSRFALHRASGGDVGVDDGDLVVEHTPENGTVVFGSTRAYNEQLKRHGLRWSSQLGAWYVPQSRDRLPQRARIERLAEDLRAAGARVDVDVDERMRPAAEREAGRADRLAERQERLQDRAERRGAESAAQLDRAHRIGDVIPMGQPILVGHHSEGRHRRDLERIDTAMSRGVAGHREAADLQRRAEASRSGQEHRESLPATLRRIQRLEAEHRQVERRLQGDPVYEGGRMRLRPPDDAYAERLRGQLAVLDDDLAYWRGVAEQAEAGGVKRWGPQDFAVGDTAISGGSRYRVVRVNAKSLTVPSPIGSWTDTLPYDKVQGKA